MRTRSGLKATVAALIFGAAGFGMGWLGVELYPLQRNTTFLVADACRICGRVERVRELESSRHAALNGDQCEGIVMMIAALGGRVGRAAHLSFPTYETAVRLDDGSMRIVRDTGAPAWKAGDRVKVVKGRVQPLT